MSRRAGVRRSRGGGLLGLLVVLVVVAAIGAHGSGSATTSGTATRAATVQRTAGPGPADDPGPTSGPASSGPASSGPTSSSEAAPPVAGTALAAVARLPVKGRAPTTGYDRTLFGYRTVDVDRNGCDVRNDVLRRDLVDVVIRAGTAGCVVQTGTLHDPYTGTTIAFTRGATTSEAVQIDHVVALSDAWQTGAQGWDTATLHRFGNDPLELLAVSGPANDRKGDGDTATWLPPSTGYRCTYVARQVAVKLAYGLWVTPAESAAMSRVLTSCPDQPLPTADPVPPLVP